VIARALLVAAVLSSSAAAAERTDCDDRAALGWRGVTLRVENDLFIGRDRDYTSGVALTAISNDLVAGAPAPCLPWPLERSLALLEQVHPALLALARADADAAAAPETSPVVANAVLRISQSMYTPRDRTRTDLVVDDRPYAGLLAMSVAWNLRHAEPARGRDRLDTVELTLGVIGPASLARQAQDAVHELIGVDRFLGWDHQLGNEPALQLAVERRWRQWRDDATQVQGWSAEAIRSAGLRLGNIQTSAAAGIEWRAGWNLPNDFGAYPLGPGAENRPPAPAAPRASAPRRLPGAQVFASAELRAVAWDFSLDGNLLRSSHHVTREPLVAQLAIGWGLHGPLAGRGWRLTAMRVWRSREFDGDRSHQSFGSIALGVEW
jgi:hypothetical protein